MCRCIVMPFLVAVAASLSTPIQGGDKKAPDKKDAAKSFLLIVPAAGGKEVKLMDWRFTHGTCRLDLTGKDPKAAGEYLEFREEKSTNLKNGIYTFIALPSLRKLDYDRDKKTVTAVVIEHTGTDATLVGSTKAASNKIAIEGEAILDGLGAATVKFQGGTDKGIQSVAFPLARKPGDKVTGTLAVVAADDKEKTKHAVADLQPVYLVDGQYRVVPYLMFKKTVKIGMDKLVGMRYVPPEDKKSPSAYEVTLKDGAKHTLSLLTVVELEKKKTMTFVGMIGRIPVGYKLFMLDSIYEFQVGAPKEKLEARGNQP